MKRLLYTCIAVILLGVSAIAAAYWYFMSFEPDRSIFPILGIDVSHHQGDIDWNAVAKDDVTFAFIKATEGGDWKDKRFLNNWKASKQAGIIRGAYHFFTFCRPGTDQAKNFINTVPNEPDSLPPAVDLEFGGNCSNQPDAKQLTQELNDFLTRIEAAYDKKPILYVTPEFYEAFATQKFLKTYPLWVRNILFQPDYVQGNWTFWQFHNRGRRKGITGPVDLNVFHSNKAAFESLTK